MTIEEKAKQYAEGKAIDALTSAIEKAYIEGYNAGRSEALSNTDEVIDNVKYVDLGLPSGTKWAAGYVKDKFGGAIYLPYEKAQTMNIPTKEQYDELLRCCKLEKILNPSGNTIIGYSLVAKSGKMVVYYADAYYTGIQRHNCNYPQFWLKGEEQKENTVLTAKMGNSAVYEPIYMGFSYPIVLVR